MRSRLNIEQITAILTASSLVTSWQFLEVGNSDLSGNPVQDLPYILNQLETFLTSQSDI